MPQPRQAPRTAPTAPPPSQQPRQPSAIGASLAAATAAPAGLVTTAAIEAAAAAKAVGAVTSGMAAMLRKLSLLRIQAVGPLVQRHATPVNVAANIDRPGALAALAEHERRRERTFQRRQLARVRRDLPRVMAITNERVRRRRLEGLVGRERHYTRLRLDAIAGRAAGVANSLNVEAASPQGCVWQLGRTQNHTAGCLLLHGHALTWRELRAAGFIPPLHLHCDCGLHVLPDGAPAPSPARTIVLIAEAKRLEADE